MVHDLFGALLHIAQNRTSVREFSSRQIPDELIDKIIRIAETAPYATSRKNWGIEVVSDRGIIERAAAAVEEKTGNLQSKVRESYRDSYDAYVKNFSFFKNAPVLLIPCFRVAPTFTALLAEPDETVQSWERDNYVKSISCVVMMVLLAAESLGLGACCVTGALIAEDALLKIVPVKNGRQIGAIIPIGYKTGKGQA
jgi:nitroreductase